MVRSDFDRAGDVLAVGQSQGSIDFGNGSVAGLGGQDGFLAKYAGATGAYLWAQLVGGTSNDRATSVATDGSNNVIVGGYFNGTATFGSTTWNAPAGTPDGFVVKHTVGGATTWAQRVISIGSDAIQAVATAPNGDVSVTGYYYQSASFDGQGMTGGTDGDAFIGHLGP